MTCTKRAVFKTGIVHFSVEHMENIIVTILAIAYLCGTVYGNCYPVGKSRCFDSKWETCLTKEYITDKTKSKMSCTDQNQTSCWFPCEKELFAYEASDLDNGGTCLCMDNDDLPATILPQSCTSPNVLDCTWYSSCLKNSKCYWNPKTELTGKTYSEQVCNMFQTKTNYSQIERNWLQGVARCFQFAFVPLLRPWAQHKCQIVSKTITNAMSDCYIQNTNDTPSICDVEPIDWGKHFSIILKGIEVIINYQEYYLPFYHMIKAFDKCDVPITLSKSSTSMILIRPYVVALKKTGKNYHNTHYQNEAINAISNTISNLDLSIKGGTRVFVYPENITKVGINEGFEMSTIIIIVSKLYYVDGVLVTSINMTSAHQELTSLIELGRMEFSKRQSILIRSMNVCFNGNCQKFTFNKTPSPTPKPDEGVKSFLIWVILASVLVVLVSIFICIIRCIRSDDMDTLNQIGMVDADREVGTDKQREEGDGLEHEERKFKDDLNKQGPMDKQVHANTKRNNQKNLPIDSPFFF